MLENGLSIMLRVKKELYIQQQKNIFLGVVGNGSKDQSDYVPVLKNFRINLLSIIQVGSFKNKNS